MDKIQKNEAKQVFVDSLWEILNDKPISKITVAEVSKNSGFTRQTFYNHFKDIDDLLNYIHKILTEDLTKYFYQNKNVEESFRLLFKRMQEYPRYYSQVAKIEGPNSFKNYYAKLGCLRGKKFIGEVALSEEVEFSIQFYWDGISKYIVDWIKGGMKIAPETMARMLTQSMPKNLVHYYGLE